MTKIEFEKQEWYKGIKVSFDNGVIYTEGIVTSVNFNTGIVHFKTDDKKKCHCHYSKLKII